MSEVNFTDICTAYTDDLVVRGTFAAFEMEHPPSSVMVSIKVLGLIFATYPKNVPEPAKYTAEDMLKLANDPVLLEKYGAPFCITALYHENRPALYVTPHAYLELASAMDCPSDFDSHIVVVRASEDEPPQVLDVREVVANCPMPEKFIYGCSKCLGLNKTIIGTCAVRKAVGADNPYYGAKSNDEALEDQYNYESPITPKDERRIRSWGRYESPFKSQTTKMGGHLYVSPVMFHESKQQGYYRKKAFISLKDITADDICFDAYESNVEPRQTAADTRRKHALNAKTYCPQCSVKSVCHNRYKHKKNYCNDPLPPTEDIDKYFTEKSAHSIPKETIVDILLASGDTAVINPKTRRKCDAYISLHEDFHGLGFRAMSRVTGNIIDWGVSAESWEAFKKENNINTKYSYVASDDLKERLDNPAMFAKLLACAAIKVSPVRTSMFHATAYDKAYITPQWNGFCVKFRWNSKRRVCYWDYTVTDWEDLFKHYGKIPGFR